ncbi:UNVERIFIED_CONTAM: hypothetical protein B566_EDAN019123 [Ephemera danica]|nr:hypothetical protein B566_EDAN019123 [Ephemera danica]
MKEKDLGVTRATPPRHPEHITIQSRLKSFELWPPSMKQTPDMLAEAGFFYKEVGDRVICFQCGGGLHTWGNEDDPWEEHAKWFPNCSYLILKKGIQFTESVKKQEVYLSILLLP